MNKDIVYIDTEDDITAIIGKLKTSKEKIVALVPPKRSSVLQSAVNLRLLDRAAKQHDKQIVLVTSNKALSSLAGAASIPVAKTLQSKPELPEIDVIDVDNGEDVIDGASLAVGEHADTVPTQTPEEAARDRAVGSVAIQDAEAEPVPGKPEVVATTSLKERKRDSVSQPKVPNFSRFRKRLFIGAGAGILLIGFLIWALVFAPRATIVIKARTTDVGVSQRVTLTSGSTAPDKLTIHAETKTSSQDVSKDFTATGTKDVGQKAQASATFTNSNNSVVTVKDGTVVTSSAGLKYVVSGAVTIPAATLSFSCSGFLCPGTATGTVVASSAGSKYNADSGSLSGLPSGVTAKFSGATSGGTDKTVTVATADDISKAMDAAKASVDANAAKAALTKDVGSDYIVIGDSFAVDTSGLQSSVQPDTEVTGTPKIAGKVNFKIAVVKKDDLKTYLQSVISAQLASPDSQQVYETGADTAQFTNVTASADGYTASLVATGKTGPKIDTEKVKALASGKKLGDIQSQISAINGVDTVEVHFSPFWVNTAPSDVKKITVEFSING